MRTLDFETTVHALNRRKASPFNPHNWVVAAAYKDRASPDIQRHYFGRKAPPDGWFVQMLDNTKLLVGHNIKFDLQHAIFNKPVNYSAYREWVVNGGQVWDTQLAEYLLNGMVQEDHSLALDETAPRYGGDLKDDEVKLLWQAGVMTEDIDPHILMRYLCGGTMPDGTTILGDIGNTELIAKAQMKRASEVGQLNSIMLNMGALLATVEMELNGMYVNKDKGLVHAAELQSTLEDLQASLNSFLPPNLPFEFKWSNQWHLSPLIYGGVINYDSREYVHADGSMTYCSEWNALPEDKRKPLQYASKDEEHIVLADGGSVREDLFDIGSHEPAVYKSGINAGLIKRKKVKVPDTSKPKARNCKQPFEFPGFCDPVELGLKPNGHGLYSTGKEWITELSDTHDYVPFLKALGKVSWLAKELGTYYVTTNEEGKQSGMLTLVDDFNLIHHTLHMVRTVTARLSSADPNLQNIPRAGEKAHGNSRVKELFESRFGEDGKIIQSDYTSLEIYMQAILTNCQALIRDLRAGLDMHAKRVSMVFKVPYAEALAKSKGYKLPDGTKVEPEPEWEVRRTNMKVFSFQRAYGAGAKKIANYLKIGPDTVEGWIAAEQQEYPELEDYFEQRGFEVKRNRRPTAEYYDHPDVPGIKCNPGVGYCRTPDGKLYSYREAPTPASLLRRDRTASPTSFSPTIIKNYEVQGSGGEWAKAAMWLAIREFYRNDNWGGDGLLVNQVHDALYADTAGHCAFEVAATLHACMLAANDLMEYWFAWDLAVPVPTETKWGPNMADETGIKGLEEAAAPLRAAIRERYMGGYTPTYLN